MNEDKEFLKIIYDYENALLVFRIDQDEIWKNVKVTESDISKYYINNLGKYTVQDTSGKYITKPLEIVRSEISNELQVLKFREVEGNYIEALKQKYPLTINEEVLSKAFIQ